jgi:hypothetical protein
LDIIFFSLGAKASSGENLRLGRHRLVALCFSEVDCGADAYKFQTNHVSNAARFIEARLLRVTLVFRGSFRDVFY